MDEKRIKLAKQFLNFAQIDKQNTTYKTNNSSNLFNLYNGFVSLFDNEATKQIYRLTNIDIKPALDYARNDSDLYSQKPVILSNKEYELLEQKLIEIIRDLEK